MMKRTALVLITLLGMTLTDAAGASAPAQGLSSDDLARRTIERRAVEAVIWGMPAVNFELLSQAMVQAGAHGTRSSIGRAFPIGRTRR